jgi:hypothetical protein
MTVTSPEVPSSSDRECKSSPEKCVIRRTLTSA